MDWRIQCVMAYMEENLHFRVSIGQLARHVNLSYSHLCHMFRAETGFSPAQYLNKLRLRHAKKLLEQTYLTVKEIAGRTGMDESHFVRNFRHAYGSPPGNYRLKAQSQLRPRTQSLQQESSKKKAQTANK